MTHRREHCAYCQTRLLVPLKGQTKSKQITGVSINWNLNPLHPSFHSVPFVYLWGLYLWKTLYFLPKVAINCLCLSPALCCLEIFPPAPMLLLIVNGGAKTEYCPLTYLPCLFKAVIVTLQMFISPACASHPSHHIFMGPYRVPPGKSHL